ncbi:hypothetical protein RA280_40035 [Cupriavidus sp. CV2]|uniref:hypothetical protein n=1 Tax=Cupriavidus ulmosensis TaxID=3065913 RepID=UPI00296B0FE5|nr:hypothetical protein [Cupriavidus sp. CV2]MDW3687817.1 hypothetical protein [Cupriavidus sp. CV2]
MVPSERDLCERLRVSPLHAGYSILAADGLVLPKRGAQVIELSSAGIGNLFDLLSVLGGLAARLATERASDAELAGIARLRQAMLRGARHQALLRG